jgi:hypothetical protein
MQVLFTHNVRTATANHIFMSSMADWLAKHKKNEKEKKKKEVRGAFHLTRIPNHWPLLEAPHQNCLSPLLASLINLNLLQFCLLSRPDKMLEKRKLALMEDDDDDNDDEEVGIEGGRG